ncbi:MAG: ATPase V [Spirochaetales bacterium]|nr:ATPase V [Spirochaetales bacterium]
MSGTASMRLLVAAAPATASDAISRELLALGALDAVAVRELEATWKDKLRPDRTDAADSGAGELRKRVEGFFQLVGRAPEIRKPAATGSPVDLAAASRVVEEVSEGIAASRERQKALQDELLRLDEVRKQVAARFGSAAGELGRGASGFLSVRSGTVARKALRRLEDDLASLPVALIARPPEQGERADAIVMSLKRDERTLEPILARAEWVQGELPSGSPADRDEALKGIEAKAAVLRTAQRTAAEGVETVIGERSAELSELWTRLRVDELSASIRAGFSSTERAVLFSGWIPARLRAATEEALERASGGACVIEWHEPASGEARKLSVPVQLRNPRLLGAFQGLVTNYGTPEYGSIDPTPFVAVSYLAMFGLMFGDAGHGLVVALAGVLGLLRARARGKKTALFELFAWCGLSAMVAGVLFGSWFGLPLTPALWFDFHGVATGAHASGGPVRDVYGILGISIKFGMIVLVLGILLNWYNLARSRRWRALLVGKHGLAGGWIYMAGAWIAFGFVASGYRTLPSGPVIALLLGPPVLLLGLAPPLEHLEKRRKGEAKGFPVGIFLLEWAVELLEAFSGYLANTLSFMRVAGLGIAHATLMGAFFSIADMVGGRLSLAGIAILLLGNALVIVLEGLSAGIQALRLNYYEFFSKYFNGTGRAYRPISLGGS